MNNKNYFFIKPFDEEKALPPRANFKQILKEYFLEPFKWNGRTSRRTYWLSVIIVFLLMIIMSFFMLTALISGILGNFNDATGVNEGMNGLKVTALISLIIALFIFTWTFISSLGMSIRRLHDLNYSGYWYWLTLIPFGNLFLFYLFLQPSIQRPVRWGSYLSKESYGPEPDKAYYNQEYSTDLDVPVRHDLTVIQMLKEQYFHIFTWKTRATRSTFWFGSICNLGILLLSMYISSITGKISSFYSLSNNRLDWLYSSGLYGYLLLIPFLILSIWAVLSQLALLIRRLHDTGHKAWWLLLIIFPYLNLITLALIFHPTTTSSIKWTNYTKNDEFQKIVEV